MASLVAKKRKEKVVIVEGRGWSSLYCIHTRVVPVHSKYI